ncbi:hypothetical protein [Deinococcus xianganensis]|uniref:Uncharacterized protein n=1 Tax=Deinococcus xianganensis TaxID=1507289 RepID=A0A6I4YEK1_9DEIO|nr:hypothetical protein [Deinococcus xianganensis]MXV20799.1 hypothetical protein [Deinococcus xianganensis]
MEVQGCAVERLTLAEYAALRGLPAVPVPKGAPWAEEVPTQAPVLSGYPLPRLGQIATRRLTATGRAHRASAAAVAHAALRDAPATVFEHLFGIPELVARQVAVRREFAALLVFGRPLGDWGTYYLDLRADSEARRAHHQPSPAEPVDETPAPAEVERLTADLPALDLAVGDAVQASVIGAATVTHVLAYPDGTRLAVARSRVGEQLLRPGTYTRADLPAAAPAPTPPAPLPAPVDVPSPALKPTVMPSLF